MAIQEPIPANADKGVCFLALSLKQSQRN